MVKKAKTLEPIGEGFEDVVETLIKKEKKYMKQDVPVRKVKAKKDKKAKKNN